jgi:hypothetical protein
VSFPPLSNQIVACESGTPASPGFDFVLEGEDRVVLLVPSAMDGEALVRLPTPDCALAAIQEGSDLLPGFERLLRRVSLHH